MRRLQSNTCVSYLFPTNEDGTLAKRLQKQKQRLAGEIYTPRKISGHEKVRPGNICETKVFVPEKIAIGFSAERVRSKIVSRFVSGSTSQSSFTPDRA